MAGSRYAVLRVHAEDPAIHDLFKYWEAAGAVSWRAGEIDHGETLTTSGFNIDVAEVDDNPALARSVRDFLDTHRDMFPALSRVASSLVLDVGLMVGSDDHFVVSALFEPELLSALAAASIAIKVTGYPCSD